jgi:putative PIN family toxin of toxin-antitoxin system
MIRAVLDTNVLVSALRPSGNSSAKRPRLVLRSALDEAFRCYLSASIIEEYETVLRRRRLLIPASEAAETLRRLRTVSELLTPKRVVVAALDPSDNKFLECALEARADYIVTGNLRHFPARFQDIRVVSPSNFLILLASQL